MKKHVFPEHYGNSMKLFLINEFVSNERDRQINVDWHLNGKTQEQIAEDYRLSTRRVQEILQRDYHRMMDGAAAL